MADQEYTDAEHKALADRALSQPLVSHIYTADPSRDPAAMRATKRLLLAAATGDDDAVHRLEVPTAEALLADLSTKLATASHDDPALRRIVARPRVD